MLDHSVEVLGKLLTLKEIGLFASCYNIIWYRTKFSCATYDVEVNSSICRAIKARQPSFRKNALSQWVT